MTLLFVLASRGDEAERRRRRPMQRISERLGLWNSVLWDASNDTGLMTTDPVAESWLRQVFADKVVPSIKQERVSR